MQYRSYKIDSTFKDLLVNTYLPFELNMFASSNFSISLLFLIHCLTILNIEALFKQQRYNPDVDLTVPQIIARHGYESESHTIVNPDGYLLTLHRIPASRNGKRGGLPVYLQHGLLGCSADWIINGNNSLAFLLADSGYDVWLGNARGNTYSKGHVSLSIDSPVFWNFSWHEMGTRDLPACFSYVGNITGRAKDIHYIGHSMGTTMFFVFASILPEIAKDIKSMISLAPVAYLSHVKSPIKYLAPFAHDIGWIVRFMGINDFLPNNKLIKFLAHDCELLNIDRTICENLIFIISGFDKKEFNQAILPVIFSKLPAGTSTKTIIHYAQEIYNHGAFQEFDYGAVDNLKLYGQKTPPKYNITNISTPIYLMYSINDWLASEFDVKAFSKQIINLIELYKVPMDSFNHVDFIFGKDAEKLVYQPILKWLKSKD